MADELNGFDMVWAITEKTLNEQLAWRFTRPAPPGQPSMAQVTFGELFAADGTTVKDGLHVDAVLGAPRIEIPAGNTSTIELFIPFASGTLQHLGVGSTGVYTVDLAPDPKHPAATTWTLCFKVDLNLADITPHLDCAAGTPPATMHQETYTQLCQFKSSGFTIQQVFLNLENVDLASFLPQRSSIPAQVMATVTTGGTTTANQPDPGAAQALQLALLLYFKNLSADPKSSPYILGYSANATANQPSALQPTGTAYSTHRYQPVPHMPTLFGASTLNLLLVTNHRTPPRANLAFNYNLVSRAGISGTGRIAPGVVCLDWLGKASQPGGGSLITSLAWTIGVAGTLLSYNPDHYEWSGIERITIPLDGKTFRFGQADQFERRDLSIKLSKRETDAHGRSGPGLAINGAFGIELDLHNKDLGHGQMLYLHPYSFSLVMLPGAGKVGAAISLSQSNVTKGKPTFTSTVQDRNIFDYLTALIVAEGLAEKFERVENLHIDQIGQSVGRALQALSTQIVLPAPSTFTYHGLEFDDQLTLITDFTYTTR